MTDVSDKLTLAHISETVAKLAESLERIEDKIDPESELYILAPLERRVAPVIEIYDGSRFIWRFIIGLSILVVSIGSIGAGAIYMINWIRHGG